jgi:hypothetical protein
MESPVPTVVPEPPEVGPRTAPDIGPHRLFDSRLLFVWLAVVAGILACDGGKTLAMGSHAPFAGCTGLPTAPPAALGLNPFYVKYLDGYGTPVVSSANVTDEALLAACRTTGNMVAKREDVRLAMASHNHRVAVIAENERTTDIPEYADLYTVFPNTDWNTYRAVSATVVRPVTSTSEENLRCLPGDMYEGDSALVWTLAHGLLDLGIVDVDPQFGGEVQTAYTSAMAKGLWAGTSATAKANDYWAVGSLAWFGASTRLPVKSRDELASYDAPLADLLGTYLPANDWHPGCYGH